MHVISEEERSVDRNCDEEEMEMEMRVGRGRGLEWRECFNITVEQTHLLA